MEEDYSLGSDLTTVLWSRRRNVGNEVNGQGLVEVMVVAMDAEAVANHFSSYHSRPPCGAGTTSV
jgi:hypothetical protein